MNTAETARIPTIHVSGPGGGTLESDDATRRRLLDARERLDALMETWSWAAEAVRTGSGYVDPIRRRGQLDDHLIWDLGHARDHQRISRTDGEKGDRRRPVVRIGRSASGESRWEVQLHGRARPTKDMARITSQAGIDDGLESLLMASACLDAALVPSPPSEMAAARAAIEAVAHEEASIREASHAGPGHLKPSVVTSAPTPWCGRSMRLSHPHGAKSQRIVESRTRTLPTMVNLLASDEGLYVSPHRFVAPLLFDPVARLRILSAIEDLAPREVAKPGRRAA